MESHIDEYNKNRDALSNVKRRFVLAYDYFTGGRYKDRKDIAVELKKIETMKNMLDNTINRIIDFENMSETETKAEVHHSRVTVKDAEKFLGRIIGDLENKTGKKIHFKKDMK